MNDDGELYGILLNLIGIFIGLQNLEENRKQSEANNVEKHNQKQAEVILNDLHSHFDMQNKILQNHTELLEQILKILKGEK